MTTRAEQRRARSAAAELDRKPWRSRAFGLEIDGDFHAPGLPPANRRGDGPRTRLEVVPRSAIDVGWPRSGATRVMEEWFGGATPAPTNHRKNGFGHCPFPPHLRLARHRNGRPPHRGGPP